MVMQFISPFCWHTKLRSTCGNRRTRNTPLVHHGCTMVDLGPAYNNPWTTMVVALSQPLKWPLSRPHTSFSLMITGRQDSSSHSPLRRRGPSLPANDLSCGTRSCSGRLFCPSKSWSWEILYAPSTQSIREYRYMLQS